MTVPTNAVQTFAMVGIREELSDAIMNISPTETPFMSMIRKGTTKSRTPEWQKDRLRDPSPTNITVEGDDGRHMSAMVIDESFRGMNRVQQQRAVYAALKGKMDGPDGELHALALTTRAPE